MTSCCDRTRFHRGYHDETGKPCPGWGPFPVGAVVVNRGEPNTMTVLKVVGDDRLCAVTELDGTVIEHLFPVESLHKVGDCIRVSALR